MSNLLDCLNLTDEQRAAAEYDGNVFVVGNASPFFQIFGQQPYQI